MACSDQLVFHELTANVWLDWLPASLFTPLGLQSASNMTVLRAAVAASAATGTRVSYSDAMRFMFLYRFGGIYIDADVLLLQNMEPFTHYEFLYEWSYVNQGTNSAVFSTRPQSPFTAAVILQALQKAVRYNSTTGNVTFDALAFTGAFHPISVMSRVPPAIAAQIVVLPSIPFDAIWLTVDAGKPHNLTAIHRMRHWRDFFAKPQPYLLLPGDPVQIFEGAFAYHWHNEWGAPLEKTSLIGQLMEAYDLFLQGKEPNNYGLMATPCTLP